jgi:uncharacterized phage-associated protein
MYIEYCDKKIDTKIDTAKADLFAAAMLEKLGGRSHYVNYLRLMKLLYLADRFHLRTYMRPIAFDDYYAMKKGVVGSYWLDLLRGKIDSKYFISDKTACVKSRADIGDGIRALSESELESLNFAVEMFSKFDENQLVDIVHEYPEWKKHEKRFSEDMSGREEIKIQDILDDPQQDNLVFKRLEFSDPFISLSAEEKELIFEEITDSAIESV